MRFRLSILMFLQYAPCGALLPLFTLRLEELGLDAVSVGWICATQAMAALVGPVVAGQVADRWLPAERCLSLAALAAGVLLWVLAELTTPVALFASALAMWLFMGPAVTLGTAVSFAHLADPEKDFGRVRLWGTVGWVAAGWLLSLWFDDPPWLRGCLAWLRPHRPVSELADAFRLGGLLAFGLAAYACTLPHTPPKRRPGAGAAPVAALRLLRTRSLAVVFACTLGAWMTMAFTTQATPLLLRGLGVEPAWVSRNLTVSQTTEVAALAVLPLLLFRLGRRRTMLLGLAAWVLLLTVHSIGRPLWLVVASLALHGLLICCFFISGQVYVNSRARGDCRASAQALLTLTGGLGLLAGNLLAGWVRGWAAGELPPTFAVATGIALALAVGFLLLFCEEEPAPAAAKA